MSNPMQEVKFKAWKDAIDDALQASFGIHLSDMADAPLRLWFEDEMSPADALRQILEDEGWDGD